MKPGFVERAVAGNDIASAAAMTAPNNPVVTRATISSRPLLAPFTPLGLSPLAIAPAGNQLVDRFILEIPGVSPSGLQEHPDLKRHARHAQAEFAFSLIRMNRNAAATFAPSKSLAGPVSRNQSPRRRTGSARRWIDSSARPPGQPYHLSSSSDRM